MTAKGFLDLPLELRHMIYDLLFPEDGRTIAIVKKQKHLWSSFCSIISQFSLERPSSFQPPLAMLATCTTIHNELASLVYHRMHFGLFLASRDGSRHKPTHIHGCIDRFAKVLQRRTNMILNIDLGVGAAQNLGLNPSEGSTSKEPRVNRAGGTIVGAMIVGRQPETPWYRRLQLHACCTKLALTLPAVRCVTFHDTHTDPFPLYGSFVRQLTELFPHLEELRVMQQPRGEERAEWAVQRYRVDREDMHLITWPEGKDLGRVLVSQRYF